MLGLRHGMVRVPKTRVECLQQERVRRSCVRACWTEVTLLCSSQLRWAFQDFYGKSVFETRYLFELNDMDLRLMVSKDVTVCTSSLSSLPVSLVGSCRVGLFLSGVSCDPALVPASHKRLRIYWDGNRGGRMYDSPKTARLRARLLLKNAAWWNACFLQFFYKFSGT